MAFATFHITGYKDGLIGLSKHIDRLAYLAEKKAAFLGQQAQELTHILGLHIDPSRNHLNEEWIETNGKTIAEMVEERIKQGHICNQPIRKDAIKALGLIMTGTHQRMKEIEANKVLFESWKQSNWEFVCREFGGSKNIVRFAIHRDEKTPHIHCVVVPITPDGRLSAKHYRDGISKLQGYQDRYAQAMQSFGLERGVESKLTARKHETSQSYYKRINQIQRQINQETKHINSFNPLHRQKAKQEMETVAHNLKMLQAEKNQLQKEVAYTLNTHKTIIERQMRSDLDLVKREVNLIQHVAAMGYKLNKDKSSKTWAVMEKENDKILIKNGPNKQGHWMYKSLSDENEKGTIVDFMKKRGCSYQMIRGLVSHHLDNAVVQVQAKLSTELRDQQVKQEVAQLAFERVVEHDKGNYLQSRGIQKDTYRPYQRINLKVGNKAVFALYENINHQGNGQLCSTITYQFAIDHTGHTISKKYFQKGLPRGVSVLKEDNHQITRLIITENPIDALIHKQMYKEGPNTMYVATCGSLSENVQAELSKILTYAKEQNQQLVLAFDSDPAGKKMAKQVMDLANRHQVTIQHAHPTQKKDWNQLLQDGLDHQVLAELKKRQKELETSGQEYQLIRKKHQILDVLGIQIVAD